MISGIIVSVVSGGLGVTRGRIVANTLTESRVVGRIRMEIEAMDRRMFVQGLFGLAFLMKQPGVFFGVFGGCYLAT